MDPLLDFHNLTPRNFLMKSKTHHEVNEEGSLNKNMKNN